LTNNSNSNGGIDVRDLAPLEEVETLSTRTTEVLRGKILEGEFELGEHLVEATIARRLGISRGPVRDALKQLRAEGLVHERPNRGSFVVDLSPDDISEIYELRAAIEARSARLVIASGGERARAMLELAFGEMQSAAKADDWERFSRSDLALHETLCKASGNERLHRVFVSQAAVLGILLRLERRRASVDLPQMLAEHDRLLAAILSGDPEQAAHACDEHLTKACKRVLAWQPAAPSGDPGSRV
jgi:GntR family transcriptional regulator of gluconate operon